MNRSSEWTCEEVQEALWPLDRPRPHTAERASALEHLSECAECQGFFDRDKRVDRLLERVGLAGTAPGALRESVFDALARERALRGTAAQVPGPRRHATPSAVRAAVAAIVLIGAIGGIRAIGGPANAPGESEYVKDFMSRAVEEDVVERPDPQAVSRFFMRELGMGITPVVFEEARLSRAMICLIRGERAAMVEYIVNGTTVAHYRIPVAEGTPEAKMSLASESGVQMARWTDGEFEHALVSELSVESLGAIARNQFAIAE